MRLGLRVGEGARGSWRAEGFIQHAGMLDFILRSVEDFKQGFVMSSFSLSSLCRNLRGKDKAAKINLHIKSI